MLATSPYMKEGYRSEVNSQFTGLAKYFCPTNYYSGGKHQGKLFAGIQISKGRQNFLWREVFERIHGRDSNSLMSREEKKKIEQLS